MQVSAMTFFSVAGRVAFTTRVLVVLTGLVKSANILGPGYEASHSSLDTPEELPKLIR
jgi:hypothetical protein